MLDLERNGYKESEHNISFKIQNEILWRGVAKWDSVWEKNEKHQSLPKRILGTYPMGDLGKVGIWWRDKMGFLKKEKVTEYWAYCIFNIYHLILQHIFEFSLIHPWEEWKMKLEWPNDLCMAIKLLRDRDRIWSLELVHMRSTISHSMSKVVKNKNPADVGS